MKKSYFVTATDTDAGKTFTTCSLIRYLRKQGINVNGFKPVETGFMLGQANLGDSDASALLRVSAQTLDYCEVNPLRFAIATSPHIAAKAQSTTINLAELSQAFHQLQMKSECVIAEGAGGWFTPLNDKETLADWVKQEQLPVIMVVGMKLGCINHALLTVAAIEQAGLTLCGWIANAIEPNYPQYDDYLATLKQSISAPLLAELPHCHDGQYPEITLMLDA